VTKSGDRSVLPGIRCHHRSLFRFCSASAAATPAKQFAFIVAHTATSWLQARSRASPAGSKCAARRGPLCAQRCELSKNARRRLGRRLRRRRLARYARQSEPSAAVVPDFCPGHAAVREERGTIALLTHSESWRSHATTFSAERPTAQFPAWRHLVGRLHLLISDVPFSSPPFPPQ
jgi:hypothetical protein